MNSFKLFSRTNKNVNVSSNLNGKEIKEKDHLQSYHKNNINSFSTTHFKVSTIDKGIGETKNNIKDIKENNICEESKNIEEILGNIDFSIKNKENQNGKESKKEKNKRLKKKEKKKNKKNKNNKLNSEQSPLPSSKPESKLHTTDRLLHHSFNSSRKDSTTGKYIGKQSVCQLMTIPKDNTQSEFLIKCYNENTQLKQNNLNDIKEKQSHADYASNRMSDEIIENERCKTNGEITLTRPIRKESRKITIKNNNIFIQNQKNHITSDKNININNINNGTFSVPVPILIPNKETGKDQHFKFNADGDSILNLSGCHGMVASNSPAFSTITPISGDVCYNDSIDDEIGNSFFAVADSDISNREGHFSTINSYKLENMIKEEEQEEDLTRQEFSKLFEITEENQIDKELTVEIKEHETPLKFSNHDNIDEEFFKESKYNKEKEKEKVKQKPFKGSKRKDKKNK